MKWSIVLTEPVNTNNRPRVSFSKRMAFKDASYRKWLERTILLISFKNAGREPSRFHGELHCRMLFYIPTLRELGKDVDNMAKSCMDALQKAMVIHNDRLITKLDCQKILTPAASGALIEIEEVGPWPPPEQTVQEIIGEQNAS